MDDYGGALQRSESVPNIQLHEPLLPDDEVNEEMTRSHTMHFAEAPESPKGRMKRSQSFLEKIADYSGDMSVMWRLTGLEEDDDDDESDPLVKPLEKPPHLQNNRKTFATIMKAMVGTAVLFLPDGYRQAGLLAGTLLILSSGILSTYCMVLLMDLSDHFRKIGTTNLSYGYIGKQAFGKLGGRMVDISIFTSQVGFCCAGLIFVSNSMVTVMRHLSKDAHWSHDHWLGNYVILGCMPGLILLSWVRKLKKFSITNIIADVFILAGLLVVLGYGSYQLHKGIGPNVKYIWNPGMDLAIFAGTSVYMFEGIALVIPIQESMERPETMPNLMRFCMFLITGFFCIFAAVNYLSFGTNVKNIVILNMPTDSLLTPLIQLMYVLAIYGTYPLTLFPSIRILETLIITTIFKTKGKWKKNFLRTSLVLVTAVISIAGQKKLENFVSMIGSVCCVPLAFIYPAAFHMLILKKTNGCLTQAVNIFIIILGIMLMFGTAGINTYEWYKKGII